MTAGQAHGVLDREVSSSSLLDLNAHVGQSPGAAHAPRVAWGRAGLQEDGAQLVCLPQSSPTTIVPGLLLGVDPRQCCVYTPNTPFATHHALPEHLFREMVTSLEKKHFRPQNQHTLQGSREVSYTGTSLPSATLSLPETSHN